VLYRLGSAFIELALPLLFLFLLLCHLFLPLLKTEIRFCQWDTPFRHGIDAALYSNAGHLYIIYTPGEHKRGTGCHQQQRARHAQELLPVPEFIHAGPFTIY
jgi:hypothetical protein